MPSTLSNTIQQERYYTPQPSTTYQQNLQGLSVHSVSPQQSNNGVALARALGVFSDTLGNAAMQHEKNMEKIAPHNAELILAGKSPEEIAKMNVMEVLAKDERFSMRDNPYVLSLVEKKRGQMLAEAARDAYQTEEVGKNGYKVDGKDIVSPAEEVARYNKFMQNRLKEMGANTSNPEAFKVGFFDNHDKYQALTADTYIKWKDKEDTALMLAGTASDLSKISAHANLATKEQLIESANFTMAHNRLTKSSIADREKLGSAFIYDVAQKTGKELLALEVADSIIVGNKDGKPVTLGSLIDRSHVAKLAANGALANFDKTMSSELEKIRALPTPGAILDHFDKLEKDNPPLYESMKHFKKTEYEDAIRREEKTKKAKLKADADAITNDRQSAMFKQQVTMFRNGFEIQGGIKLAHSTDSLPKIETIDENGKVHTIPMPQHKVNAMLMNEFEYINSSNLSDDEKVQESMKLLSWGVSKDIAKTIGDGMRLSIDSVTPNNLPTKDGSPTYPPQIEQALKMYRHNPYLFKNTFGGDLSNKVGQLDRLVQAAGNDISAGIGQFAQTRSLVPEVKNRLEANVKNHLDKYDFSDASDFKDLEGKPVSIRLLKNQHIYQQVYDNMIGYMAAGQDASTAYDNAIGQARSSNKVFMGTTVSDNFFNGIASSDKMQIGKEVLDEWVTDFCKKHGKEKDHVQVVYDYNYRTFEIRANGVWSDAPFTQSQMTAAGNAKAQARAKGVVRPTDPSNLKDIQGRPVPNPEGDPTMWTQ